MAEEKDRWWLKDAIDIHECEGTKKLWEEVLLKYKKYGWFIMMNEGCHCPELTFCPFCGVRLP